jgi:hypothetical protein
MPISLRILRRPMNVALARREIAQHLPELLVTTSSPELSVEDRRDTGVRQDCVKPEAGAAFRSY